MVFRQSLGSSEEKKNSRIAACGGACTGWRRQRRRRGVGCSVGALARQHRPINAALAWGLSPSRHVRLERSPALVWAASRGLGADATRPPLDRQSTSRQARMPRPQLAGAAAAWRPKTAAWQQSLLSLSSAGAITGTFSTGEPRVGQHPFNLSFGRLLTVVCKTQKYYPKPSKQHFIPANVFISREAWPPS